MKHKISRPANITVGDLLRVNETLTKLEYILGIEERPVAEYRRTRYKELADTVYTLYRIIIKVLEEERVQLPTYIPGITLEEYLSRVYYGIPLTDPDRKSLIKALLITAEREKNVLRKMIELDTFP